MTSVAASLMGSSPLMPGRRGRRFDLFPGRGLIPAHAGKTSSPASPASRRQAHPRSCRENMSASVAACCASGSSPLTRGKQPPARRHRVAPCGRLGSSPLTRGKLPGVGIPERRLRLIPTHAGKTRIAVPRASNLRAHPRSCGENERTPRHEVPRRGSPPLTRGKPVSGASPHAAAGLIPTHAGKTERRDRCLHPPRAHPRSRGENFDGQAPGADGHGSSPLTWGKRDVLLRALSGPGLIPTHAGKTLPARRRTSLRGAHPRSRGENVDNIRCELYSKGSSPLTRGKRGLGNVCP